MSNILLTRSSSIFLTVLLTPKESSLRKKSVVDIYRENLALLMERGRMSQGKVHKLSGISQKAVSNILAGDQVPSIDTADRLAKVFDRSASELMTETFMIEEEVDVSSKKLATIFMKLSHRDREEILRLADLLGQRDSEPS